jgi:hypothetical protein
LPTRQQHQLPKQELHRAAVLQLPLVGFDQKLALQGIEDSKRASGEMKFDRAHEGVRQDANSQYPSDF